MTIYNTFMFVAHDKYVTIFDLKRLDTEPQHSEFDH